MSARIWVVDDDRSVRFVLAAALREAGHLVTEFEGAAPALAALAQPTADLPVPDLLFTDVRMPGRRARVPVQAVRPRRGRRAGGAHAGGARRCRR